MRFGHGGKRTKSAHNNNNNNNISLYIYVYQLNFHTLQSKGVGLILIGVNNFQHYSEFVCM